MPANVTYLDNHERFQHALNGDLGRPFLETTMLEVGPIIKEAMTAYKKVDKWAAPERVPFDINTFAMGGKVLKDPQGVTLIIGPFNYPLVSLSCHLAMYLCRLLSLTECIIFIQWCVFVPLVSQSLP